MGDNKASFQQHIQSGREEVLTGASAGAIEPIAFIVRDGKRGREG